MLALLAAAPLPEPAAPSRPPTEAVAEQFAMLAFDANPEADLVAREALARWEGPVRLFVTGGTADREVAARTLALLARATGLPMEIVADGRPNLFLAVTTDPRDAFGGPLRGLLTLALGGDAAVVDGFIARVVAVAPCWALPVFADAGRTVLKAAVIGVDAGRPRAGVERCISQKLAAGLGLLGSGGFLPRSIFTPGSAALRPSGDDLLMLRVLYGSGVQPGMGREAAVAAALAALRLVRR